MNRTMKTFKIFSMAAVALCLAACSNSDDYSVQMPTQSADVLHFEAAVAAPDADATMRTVYTKGMDAESKRFIKVKWKENDEIAAIVTNSEGKYVKDVLTVSKVNTDGSATISGDITKPKDGTKVDLIYPASIVTVADEGSTLTVSFDKMRNGTLDGTLASIADNIDYRRADDCALTVSGDKATLTSAAKLVSKLSIWKLTLQDKDGNDLSASQVTIKDGDGVTMVSSAASDSEVYLPVPAAAGIDIAISATVGGDTYYYLKGGVTLAAGKYYESTVKMAMPTNLSSISGTEYTVQNGQVLTGKLANNVKISIADDATVMLKNADINGDGTFSGNNAGITCEGDATIILEGENNKVKGFANNYSGIYVPSGNTLTIMGSGSLEAKGNTAAGIGGGYEIDCGNITINGGTITATGGQYGAGIGGGYNGSCGNITISGGTVTAKGGINAAGIGGGRFNKTCGTITITSGVTSVTATKGSGANSIGSGRGGTAITVSIAAGANVTQN